MCSNDTTLKQYDRSVCRALPCSWKMKRQIVAQLKDSVNEYLAINQDADFWAVQNHFGTPQQIASGFVEDQSTSALLHKMSVKRKIVAIVAGVAAVVILLWAGAVSWAITDVHKENDGHAEFIVINK